LLCEHYYSEQASCVDVWHSFRGGDEAETLFGVNELQEVVIVNWLSIAVTAKSLSAPSCSVAEGVTEDGAMDDNTDIPAAHDGMAPPVRRCAFTSGWDTAVVREPSSDFSGGCASEIRSHEWAVHPSVEQQLK